MCHDMTGPAIMAGRLGARTFCLPLAGIACHGLSSVGRPPLPARSAVGPASSVTWGVGSGRSASPSAGGQTSGPTLAAH